jgi:hypothetical protein
VSMVSSAAAAVALIGAGWAIGSARASGGHPAPAASRSSALVGRNSTVPAGASLGPVIQPGGPPPVPGQTPATGTGQPYVAVSQPTGDSQTIFIVHGQNWPALARLTIALAGVRRPAVHALTDRAGMFNYAINQEHEFFARGLPAGIYAVVVTGPGGRTARAGFEVLGPPAG